MMKCDVCKNEYDQCMEISYRGKIQHYDSFECAIHDLAPKCNSCGLKVIGHGTANGNDIYCSAHCARKCGVMGLNDRIPIAMDFIP